jgi:hypothetical protein
MSKDLRGQDIIDSRDVIARIKELKGTKDDDEREELKALKALEKEAGSSCDWTYGETLISDDYFEEYAEQLAEDIGAISSDAQWPLMYIDWERASNALKSDYREVDFDGQSYWIKA